jgi:hypothetical protein
MPISNKVDSSAAGASTDLSLLPGLNDDDSSGDEEVLEEG